MEKKTLVLGASDHPERYSYLALQKLKAHHQPVVAIGRKESVVDGIPIVTGQPVVHDVHTVTLYLNALHQQQYYDYILSLHPQRIIFNPGAENKELYKLAKANGIEPVEACTLVMLSTGQF